MQKQQKLLGIAVFVKGWSIPVHPSIYLSIYFFLGKYLSIYLKKQKSDIKRKIFQLPSQWIYFSDRIDSNAKII